MGKTHGVHDWMDVTVEGKKLPLNNRDILPLRELLDQTLENVQPLLTPVQKHLITRMILWFLLREMDNRFEDLG